MLIGNMALAAALLLLVAQVYRPWEQAPPKHVLHRERLLTLARLRLFGRQVALLLAAAIAGWRLGWTNEAALAVVVIGGAALLALPTSYTLTAQSIRLGRGESRRWTEFGGVARRPGGVRLQGVAGNRSMNIWLGGGHHDDEFVLLLRRLVRGSYQGRTEPETGEAPRTAQSIGTPRQAAGLGA
ncbi:MAG: hypothetical protein IT337_14855 [Thermomicrobiales bacterium]|nr:hypothetical protein [Thermomicrobiales bacterium]